MSKMFHNGTDSESRNVHNLKLPAVADSGGAPPPQHDPVPIPQPPPKSSCMTVGIILGVVAVAMIVVLGILAAISLPAISRAREAARRASCQNNLKQWGVACEVFANNNQGYWPQLIASRSQFIIEPFEPSLSYLVNGKWWFCPSNTSSAMPPAGMDPQSVIFSGRGYYYLGYAMLNEEQARAFLDAYRERRRGGGDFSEDLIVPDGQGFGGGNVIYRLKTGIERFAITDIHEPMASSNVSSSIPVMLDRDAYHEPGGINVLYLDGHVEYVAMGSKWPAKQWFMDEMAELDPMWVKKE